MRSGTWRSQRVETTELFIHRSIPAFQISAGRGEKEIGDN
jgi:hypothetical protein